MINIEFLDNRKTKGSQNRGYDFRTLKIFTMANSSIRY